MATTPGRRRPIIRGVIRAALSCLLIACALATSACSSDPRPSALSAAERADIRSRLLDGHWQLVSRSFPRAQRPTVTVARTVDDRQWEISMIDCLRSSGLTVFVDGRYFQFGETPGKTTQDFAVATYRCISKFPTVSEVVHYLDKDRLDSLYRYYVSVVRPCLLLSGEPSDAPPTRFAFVLSIHGRNSWNPYSRVWNERITSARLAFLEQLCPPVPAWLDLGR